MRGILLVSHGKMASGMLDSATLFFGENIAQLDCLCLLSEDNPAEFGERINKKIEELDTGDGVVILADLYGGTPCNQAVLRLNDRVDLISGMNFGMLLELLGGRPDDNISTNKLIEYGRNGIENLKQLLTELDANDE